MQRYAVLWWVLLLAGPVEADPGTAAPTAVLGAFEAEVVILRETLTDREDHVHMGLTFHCGRLAGRRVVVAQTGIGKVNAAMTTTLLLEHFAPREVIFTGIAGGLDPSLLPGDIVIGSATVHHDFVHETPAGPELMATRNPATGERNPLRIPADEQLLRLAADVRDRIDLQAIALTTGQRVPRILTGTIATGDAFIAAQAKKRDLHQRLEAAAVEMEGAAVAQICLQHRTPCIVIRSLSDSAGDGAVEEIEAFYQIAAHNSARFVLALLDALAENLPADRSE